MRLLRKHGFLAQTRNKVACPEQIFSGRDREGKRAVASRIALKSAPSGGGIDRGIASENLASASRSAGRFCCSPDPEAPAPPPCQTRAVVKDPTQSGRCQYRCLTFSPPPPAAYRGCCHIYLPDPLPLPDVPLARISFKGTLDSLHHFDDAIHARAGQPRRQPALLDQLLVTIASDRSPDRPGRVEPRVKNAVPGTTICSPNHGTKCACPHTATARRLNPKPPLTTRHSRLTPFPLRIDIRSITRNNHIRPV